MTADYPNDTHMELRLLPSQPKIGGIVSLTIGALFLLSKECMRHGLVSKLLPWQAFTLLCLLAILLFALAFVVIQAARSEHRSKSNERCRPPKLDAGGSNQT